MMIRFLHPRRRELLPNNPLVSRLSPLSALFLDWLDGGIRDADIKRSALSFDLKHVGHDDDHFGGCNDRYELGVYF